MGRRKGSRDLTPRKPRSDRIHKYRKKHGHFVRYIPKRQKTDDLKLWVWEVKRMSLDGYRRWNIDIRARVHQRTYKPLIRVDAPPWRIANKELVEQFMLDVVGYEGEFLLKGFSKGKNSWGVKNVTLCRVIISDSPAGLVARMVENRRLFRYWFWEK